METALEKTLKLFSKTKNEAAIGVLIPALDSPHPEVQEGALRALLSRNSPSGQREVLRRLHTISQPWRGIIEERRGQLSHAIRDAILDVDRQMCDNGCAAVLWLREYDLMPALVNASEDAANTNAVRVAETAVALAELLSKQMDGPRDYQDRRDPDLIRRHLTTTLESSLERFEHHKRKELVEALIVLARHDNPLLHRVLRDPRHPAYLPVIDVLTHSQSPSVIRLLIRWLGDRNVPHSVLNAISHRVDEPFVKIFASCVGNESSDKICANLSRMESFVWASDHSELLAGLEDAQQQGIVQAVICSGMKRLKAFDVVAFFMEYGNPGGRRAACQALAEFTGDHANKYAEMALADDDPGVVAAAVSQLRKRGIHGAMSTLIDMIEHPQQEVRAAAQQSLSEFSFDRFLAAYEMLDEDVRETTGKLVKKVDLATIPALEKEMAHPSRSRRLRALSVATAIDVVVELQSTVLELLGDEDHMVRVEAARALGRCDTDIAREELRDALGDRSVVVQEEAEKSLALLAENRTDGSPADESGQEPTLDINTTGMSGGEQSV